MITSAAADRCSREAWAASRASASARVDPVALLYPLDLGCGIDVDHDHDVESVLLPGLDQQRDDVHDHGIGGCLGLPLGRPPTYGRMHDRLQIAACRLVGEHDPSQGPAVEPPVADDVGSEAIDDGGQPRRTRLDHLASQQVGVDDHRTARRQLVGDDRLARRRFLRSGRRAARSAH